jgi:hypothetical protein
MNMVGCSISPTRFASIDWTDLVDDFGIIAGGMEDGAITLWNAKKVVENYTQLSSAGQDISQ